MPLFGNVISAVDIHTVPRPQTTCLHTTQNNKSYSVDCGTLPICFLLSKGREWIQQDNLPEEDDRGYNPPGPKADIEWNRGKKENQCNDSTEVGGVNMIEGSLRGNGEKE